jgi:putative molybdopterin biosynthesis protein
MTVRRALRQAREARGLTQAGLAEAAGVSRQSLVAIESGRSEPSVGLALRIAGILERSVEQLFASGPLTATIDVFPARTRSSAFRDGKRHAIGFIEGRWVAHGLPDHWPETMMQSADAVSTRAARGRGPLSIDLLRAPEEIRDNVLLSGCAPWLRG